MKIQFYITGTILVVAHVINVSKKILQVFEHSYVIPENKCKSQHKPLAIYGVLHQVNIFVRL